MSVVCLRAEFCFMPYRKTVIAGFAGIANPGTIKAVQMLTQLSSEEVFQNLLHQSSYRYYVFNKLRD